MGRSREEQVTELLERQEISDCLLRYCRGVDRQDRDLLLSAYHPDAVDDHGRVVLGREEFADWVFAMHRDNHVAHSHVIHNITFDIDGDVAHTETYYTAFCENITKPNMVTTGRYVDRIERRDGHWAIAARVAITDSVYRVDDYPMPAGFRAMVQSNVRSRRDRGDVSYERPLRPRRPVGAQLLAPGHGSDAGRDAASGATG
ncbi:nuclear transport factor 2 family protein [Streptomyces sp. E5N91]|uniref:nuclear transport factor 2 family protein n=1 Tax=Streptomyces sp. E5N91 TaxID=1851996 RepID=UPI000EF5CF34|nr:nuclear transport factor 2 family protein [Streptomyces sp. E5N91]